MKTRRIANCILSEFESEFYPVVYLLSALHDTFFSAISPRMLS
jgi:hypothetical protein